jgi:hypothetical protein
METETTLKVYYLVHLRPNNIDIEKEEFFGPFDTNEDAEKYCDDRYVGCGEWRDLPELVKFVKISVYPYPLAYEGFSDGKERIAYGFRYGDIYYGPFRSRYGMLKAVIEGGNAERVIEIIFV